MIRNFLHSNSLVWALCLSVVAVVFGDTGNPHGLMLQECNLCHAVSGWTPLLSPLAFNHDSTQFPLVGRHAGVSCLGCHTSLVFADASTECVSCHSDVHSGQFGNSCEQCHSATGWDERLSMQHRHSETRFPLTGRHALADCQACHWNGQLRGLETACASCHVDDYEGTMDPSHIAAGFSLACESCHSAQITDWAAPGFVHGDEFPLTAGHSGLRCVSCHSDAAYATTETACIACHRDDYEGVVSPNHHANGYPENCLECHTTSNWDATFNHNNTQFPLTGAHVQTSCQQCHVGGVFEGTPGQCIDCHLADYNGTTDPDHAAASGSRQPVQKVTRQSRGT